MRPLSVAALAVALAAAPAACKVHEPPAITAPWHDDFDRAELGSDYDATADTYLVQSGALGTRGAFNHPLWLRRKLPANAVIEVDAWSNSHDGDIKVEAWGDGASYAHNRGQYTSTGYVFVMGGWSNSKSVLARGNEHGSTISARTSPRVEIGHKYHWKIVRQGAQVDWYVDDMSTPFLSFTDPSPPDAAGHQYFAFNNWQSDSWFDNLSITPL